jgi:PIN domain nuclease of toxin-antitoxin system
MLLDTHVALWFSEGVELPEEVDLRITEARNQEEARISAISVWETGHLIRKGRIALRIPLADWGRSFLAIGGFSFVDLTLEIVLEAAELPGHFHADPADRFLVATARHHAVPIVTRDRRILDYAKAGHVQVVAC